MGRWDRWREEWGWSKYVSVGTRRENAARELAKRQKQGFTASPVHAIEGRKIATTFWGTAWCDNLEHYSDFRNRLPRGRTYVRNGSVVHLNIAPGEVRALVSGTHLYEVQVKVASVKPDRWKAICRDCAGGIDSLVELLQGRFSKAVMARICEPQAGLFPSPREIQFSCSCPDYASMCKHVAAVLYGIGARLDETPELLFVLRSVDHQELIAHAGTGLPGGTTSVKGAKVLKADNLSEIFGIEIAEAPDQRPAVRTRAKPAARKKTKRKNR